MIRIVFLLFIVVGFSACKKHDKIYTYVDPFIKSMFDWKKGRYWIMKDSLSGQVDSFAVDTVYQTFYDGSYDFRYESVYIVLFEYDMVSQTKTMKWHINLDAGQNQNEISDTTGGIPQFFPCLAEYSDFQFPCNGTNYQHVYYNNTLLIYGNPNPNYFSAYLNKVNGIVKIDTKLNSYARKWELIRSKVNN